VTELLVFDDSEFGDNVVLITFRL